MLVIIVSSCTWMLLFDISFAVFRWVGIILVIPPDLFSLIAILIHTLILMARKLEVVCNLFGTQLYGW